MPPEHPLALTQSRWRRGRSYDLQAKHGPTLNADEQNSSLPPCYSLLTKDHLLPLLPLKPPRRSTAKTKPHLGGVSGRRRQRRCCTSQCSCPIAFRCFIASSPGGDLRSGGAHIHVCRRSSRVLPQLALERHFSNKMICIESCTQENTP